ncbi:1013_t:CDS:1, partial [Funneliformis geosporum]
YKFEIAAEELFSILLEKVPEVQIKPGANGLSEFPIIIVT